MGAFSSKPDEKKTVVFTVSYAPTSKAKCKKCHIVIAKNTVRLSREIKNNWTGDKGSSLFHYHLRHGLDTVRAVKCDTGTPVLKIDPMLDADDAANVAQKFGAAKATWAMGCH